MIKNGGGRRVSFAPVIAEYLRRRLGKNPEGSKSDCIVCLRVNLEVQARKKDREGGEERKQRHYNLQSL